MCGVCVCSFAWEACRVDLRVVVLARLGVSRLMSIVWNSLRVQNSGRVVFIKYKSVWSATKVSRRVRRFKARYLSRRVIHDYTVVCQAFTICQAFKICQASTIGRTFTIGYAFTICQAFTVCKTFTMSGFHDMSGGFATCCVSMIY